MSKAYIFGILHDATERRNTFRISSKSKIFVEFLANKIKQLGSKAWIYKEGEDRNLFIVEFSKSLLRDFKIKTKKDKIDYIRGYFDAEGGIAKSSKVKFYIYFAQKNIKDLEELKSYLEELQINCGKIHNPSKKADPNYFRFYIRKESFSIFLNKISSWHPEKVTYLRRMKI